MRRIHKLFAVSASGLLLTMAVTPAALAAGTFSASPGRVAAGTAYKGTTSQGKTIKFKVASGNVTGAVAWKGKCSGGQTLTSATSFKNLTLSSGKFSASGRYRSPVQGNGVTYTGHFTVSIAGTVRRGKAHGTFSGKAKVYSGSSLITTCKSGPVTWTAKKQ